MIQVADTAKRASVDGLEVGDDRVEFKLTSEDTGGEFAVLDVTISPGGGPPMLHRHDPLEIYRVRWGELAVYIEGEDGEVRRTVAGPGAAIPIGPRLEHTVRNETREPAEATVLFSPGEPMERFARAAAELGEGSSPQELHDVAARHGIEITRPVDDAVSGARSVRRLGGGYLTIARFTGDGERLLASYREHADVMAGVGRDHGLLLHAGARTEDGFLIVNLWPSKAGSEAAARDQRRLGVIEQTGITPDQMRHDHYEVANVEIFG